MSDAKLDQLSGRVPLSKGLELSPLNIEQEQLCSFPDAKVVLHLMARTKRKGQWSKCRESQKQKDEDKRNEVTEEVKEKERRSEKGEGGRGRGRYSERK